MCSPLFCVTTFEQGLTLNYQEEITNSLEACTERRLNRLLHLLRLVCINIRQSRGLQIM